MISKEVIIKEIDNVPEELFDELHKLIKELASTKKTRGNINLMTKLRQVKIHGPKDFAENIDSYLSGEISGR